jgi:hypothetical protein
MEAVVATGYIPFACPEAISIAGDAAAAAATGLAEPDWYAAALAACAGDPAESMRLTLAVKLLRSTDFWPWRAEANAQSAGHSAARPEPRRRAAGGL